MDIGINENDREFVLDELVTARETGILWVAFNDGPESEINRYALHFFATQAEAEHYCEEASIAFINPYEDDNGWQHYVYVPVTQLQLYLMGVPEIFRDMDISISEIAAIMASQSLQPMPGQSYGQMLDCFKNNLICPVTWKQMINPIEAIAQYHVIQHRHNSGMIYETGHSQRVAGQLENYKDAVTEFGKLLEKSVLEKDGANYLLAGEFKGQKLELDIEGFPSSPTGLVLETAYWQYDTGLKRNAYQRHEFYKVDEPAEIIKYFFGTYDRLTQSVQLLNGRLEPVRPETGEGILRPGNYKHNLLITKNQKIMNQQSFEFTRDQLKNLGFGDDIAAKLHTAMDQNLAEFQLEHSREFGKDVVNSVLYFSKGDQQEKDITFFNRFDATLKQEGREDLTQTFFVGLKYNYTLQERYNMMDGRSVYREQPKMVPTEGEGGETKMKPTGETYFAWRGLDFKNADRYGNFNPKVIFWDHEKELQKYPIKNIEEKYDRSRIMRPLEKGNKINITLVRDGVETPAQVVANPRMMRLDFYSADGQSLIVRKVEKQALDQAQKAEMTPQEVQKAAIAREEEKQKQNNQPAQNQSQQQGPGENQQAAQTQSNGQAQNQKETAKADVAAEQKNNQASRKRQGVHV